MIAGRIFSEKIRLGVGAWFASIIMSNREYGPCIENWNAAKWSVSVAW